MHILSPETDNCPSWISGRERMTVENISWSISTKECYRPRRGLNPRPPGLKSDGASNWATEAGSFEPSLLTNTQRVDFILTALEGENSILLFPCFCQVCLLKQSHKQARRGKARRGEAVNEYSQSMILSRNKKNNVYPCKPQFYYVKVGFKGVNTI